MWSRLKWAVAFSICIIEVYQGLNYCMVPWKWYFMQLQMIIIQCFVFFCVADWSIGFLQNNYNIRYVNLWCISSSSLVFWCRTSALIKSNKDNRYALNSVVSHDGEKLPCWSLADLSSFREKVGLEAYNKVICSADNLTVYLSLGYIVGIICSLLI